VISQYSAGNDRQSTTGEKMKKGCAVSIAIVSWMWLTLCFAGDEMIWEKKLPFQTATIHYTIRGMENGKETLYIRDNGKERATYRETTSDMMGMKMTTRTVEFKSPEFVYHYDLEKGQGYKGVNPQKIMIEEYDKLSPGDKEKVRENAKKMGAAFTEGMGGQISQNATKMLGYDCDKVEIPGGSSTYLIHDTDIPLKTEMNMMGMKLTMTAEAVDNQVEDQAFEHPAGITAEANSESDKMAQGMARQAIAMLKEPEKTKNTTAMPQLAVPGSKTKMSAEDKEMMQQVQQMIKEMKGKNVQ
jgi:hypothetical protein